MLQPLHSPIRKFTRTVSRALLVMAPASLAIALAGASITSLEKPGILEHDILFTVYGRGFGADPILGKLGTYHGFSEMESGIQHPWLDRIKAINPTKSMKIGVELIYAMATPCGALPDCLDYLGPDIIGKYIKPAAERGWVVILDDQLGNSDPVTQVRRMIDAGYLAYDNVHIAIDPEFHHVPGHLTPGIPVGSVDAGQIDEAHKILDDYVASHDFHTKKILIVHQFLASMIRNRNALRNYPNTELVLDMDGLGAPAEKVTKYNVLNSPRFSPGLQFRGMKIFYKDPGEDHGHYDTPPMTMEQVFGYEPIPGGLRIKYQPNVIIIA